VWFVLFVQRVVLIFFARPLSKDLTEAYMADVIGLAPLSDDEEKT
jgi:hypothetical protein